MKRWLLSVVLCSSIGILHADIIFQTGNHPQPGEFNALLNSGAVGNTVFGSFNQLPGTLVQFTSTQVELEPSNGQARVSANPEGSPLTNITISLVGGLMYGDLIMNPFIGGQCTGCVSGPATVTVNGVDNLGNPEASTFTYNLGNGNNFLTITTGNGEKIISTRIDAAGGFDDLRQPRLSEISGAAVPEPSTYALLGLALGSMALIRRSRKA